MISFAQAKEDVLLWRALAPRVHHEVGFWIDIGGYDPEIDSVTKTFSDNGWRGVNVEPIDSAYRRFVEQRPNDINLRAAVTDVPGEVTFHEIVGHQLGTMVDRFADRHAAAGLERRSYTVPGITLKQICQSHAPADIHFLKIDVEGHEGAVIRGMDFEQYRPWILVIEATEPNNHAVPTYHEWDDIVVAGGYDFVFTDVLNRYYVARERPELKHAFALPPDDYVSAQTMRRIAELEAKLATARQYARDLQVELAARPAT